MDVAYEMRQVSDVLDAFASMVEHDCEVVDDEMLMVYRRLMVLAESLAERLENEWNA